MDYPLVGSPLPASHMVGGHTLPGNYRNARASPPASAMSGDWMDRVTSTSRVQAWIEKGQDGAEEVIEKRVSSDGSAMGVGEYPPPTPKAASNR